MKNLTKLAILVAAVCLLNSVALGQQKSTRKSRKPTAPPKIVCSVDAVPKGMVIVGYKDNSGCAGGRELLVKRPDASETVCANSPVPAGYIVQSISGSIQCRDAGPNPLTNALVIAWASPGPAMERSAAPLADDTPIGRAFASGASDIQVEGEGTVIRLLPDDLDGSRHQRFIVQLASGQTLLISHNIDIALRIDGLKVGDSVRFNGEYVWNEKGGVIHWTHHDPQRRHVAGWIKHNGKTFQ
jgi:hypothetical protein